MLSLANAIKNDRLDEFIAQEEARDREHVKGSELDRALALLVKSPKSEDRTSRSAFRDGSREK